MRIYSHKFYRKIYEQHYGPIPVDSDGRTYEIHHIRSQIQTLLSNK